MSNFFTAKTLVAITAYIYCISLSAADIPIAREHDFLGIGLESLAPEPLFPARTDLLKESPSFALQALDLASYLKVMPKAQKADLPEFDSPIITEKQLLKILPPDVQETLDKMGIEIELSKEGLRLTGEEGRHLTVDTHSLSQAVTRLGNLYTSNRVKHKTLHELLQEAKKPQLDISHEVERALYDKSSVLGARPDIVRQIIGNDDDVTKYISHRMQARKRSNGKGGVILVLSTGGGGGHLAQAQAICAYLEENGYAWELRLVEELIIDPIKYLTNNKFSSNSRWNTINQKKLGVTGQRLKEKDVGAELAAFGKALYALRALTFTNNVSDILMEKLQDPRYSLVIDTLPHWRNIESASIAHGIPHLRWATDFDIWHGLKDSYEKWHESFGQIMLSSQDSQANEDVRLDSRTTAAGYPLRKEIHKLSAGEKNAIRQRLNLKAQAIVVTVMMGSQGKQELEDVIRDFSENLRNRPEAAPVNLIVGVGNNFLIKPVLKSIAHSHIKLLFADELFGVPNQYLNAQQINELLNISNVLVSKAGGSQSAEILVTETPIYMYGLNGGEGRNADFLQRSGLGVLHQEGHSIAHGALSFMRRATLKADFAPIDWKQVLGRTLTKYLHPLVEEQQEKFLVVLGTERLGLGNRLREFASAQLVARLSGRKLVVDWQIIPGEIPASFNDLFTDKLMSLDDVAMPKGWTTHEMRDWRGRSEPGVVARYNLSDANNINHSDIVDSSAQWVVVWSPYRFLPKGQSFEDVKESYSTFFKSLNPTEAVDRIVEEFKAKHYHGLSPSNLVGVHYRSFPFSSDVGFGNTRLSIDYTIEAMKAEIRLNPHTHFYLASDSVEDKKTITGKFPGRVFSLDITPERDTILGQQIGLAEMYLLGYSRLVMGTKDSSFSDEAAILSASGQKIDIGPSPYFTDSLSRSNSV